MSSSILVFLPGLEKQKDQLIQTLVAQTAGGDGDVSLARTIADFYRMFARNDLWFVVMAAVEAERFELNEIAPVGVLVLDSKGDLANGDPSPRASNVRRVSNIADIGSLPPPPDGAGELLPDVLQPVQKNIVRALMLARADGVTKGGWLSSNTLKTYAGLKGQKKTLPNHTQRIRAAGLITETRRERGTRLAAPPVRLTHPLSRDSLKWAVKNFGPEEGALVVSRANADEKERWGPDWDFSIALTLGQVTLAPQKLDRRPGYAVSIDVSDDLAIYRNRGKKFLREHYLTKETRTRALKKSAQVHGAALQAIRGKLTRKLSCKPNGAGEFPFRWASGGSLLLARWRGRDWAIVFFRDMRPVGWNVANGASESIREQSELIQLIERETLEEIVLVEGNPNQPRRRRSLKTIRLQLEREPRLQKERVALARKLVEAHHKLRKEQDGFILAAPGDRVRVHALDGPGLIELVNGKKGDVAGEYLYVTIDPLDFGIEAIQIARVHLPDYTFILDGEVIDGSEKRGEKPRLARQPAGLLSLEFLEKCWKGTGGKSLGDVVDGDGTERSLGGKLLPSMHVSDKVAETDLYIFDHDYRWRRERFPAGLGPADMRWWETFGEDFDAFFENREASKSLRTLCPVTWKVLEQAFARGDLPVA